MEIPVHVVDAFASRPFTGNPAAVALLEGALDDARMQAIAAEMKHSETAFVRRRDEGDFSLRWMTPEVEVDLCGHATLATAHTLWELGRVPGSAPIRFHTRSGVLVATHRDDGAIALDLPASSLEPVDPPSGLLEALGAVGRPVHRTRFDYLVELSSAHEVRATDADHRALRALGVRGVMITAPGDEAGVDFVSRFFAPGSGIDEDPVTGSAHCALGPFWASRLGRAELRARQLSARGGELEVEVRGARVIVAGHAVTTLIGTLRL